MSEAASVRVALTFDAEHPDRPWCPPGNLERILDALAESRVRATFFVQGRWAESQPVLARRLADDGHLIGHHSHYHARMPLFHDEGFRDDIREGQRAIVDATGVDPRPWFRCPFGVGHDDPRVRELLGELGYRDVWWDVEVEDWGPDRRAAAIVAGVLEGVRARGDGAVVLLHTWPGGTGDAIRPVIDGLRSGGVALVALDELEDLP